MVNNIQNWAGFQTVNWEHVLNRPINIGSQYKVVPTEGYLAWEYNPLRNYRLSENMYEKDGKYYTKVELGIKYEDEIAYLEALDLYKKATDESTKTQLQEQIDAFEDKIKDYTLREAGELVDFITDELSFNIANPVDILPQYSYDGSVNLILNDGLNIPRLINSRFTVTGKNTYKVIDRHGDNDTNIYDQGTQFDVDTSLFKNVNKIPKLEYLGTANGNMKIGNYHFYFKYADADGNESDWVAESGLVSVFIGNTPKSINTGIRDENSIKSVRFRLSNIDIGYSYVKVFYTRYSADIDGNYVVQAKRIDKNFLINTQGTCSIFINGDENETEVTLEEINNSFDVIQTAQTQCSAANRLFMANIHKTKVEYDILSKLSLCFCPYKYEEQYPLIDDGIDHEYNITSQHDGYYDTQYIYDKTGYWPGELYRLGIVYILKDGSLSPVFNIRGATNIPTYTGDYYRVEQDYKVDEESEQQKEPTLEDVLSKIDYSEEDYMIVGGRAENENAKGVISLSRNVATQFPVFGINITANSKIIKELKNYVKGYFFVRQKRIPITMCQGIVIGLDNESKTPTIPTLGGVLKDIDCNNSYVETKDINDINYVSEGFLSRYKYNLKAKSTGFWSKLGKALTVITVIAAAAVATVVSGGTLLGPALILTSGALTTIGVSAGIAAGVSLVATAGQHVALVLRRERHRGEIKQCKGRSDTIPKGYSRKEHDDSRKLSHDIFERYIVKDDTRNSPSAIIVPDYQVNQPYYNQFLTGGDFTVRLTVEQPITNYLTDGYFESQDRHFYVSHYQSQNDNRNYQVSLVGVPDGCPIKMIGDDKYCARAGYPEEAYKYEFQGIEYTDTENKVANSDIIRGNFGAFVGMKGYQGHASDQIDIMIPGYKENDLFNYVQLRAQDTSAFYAISDRIDIHQLYNNTSILKQANQNNDLDYSLICYRGDSYICQYTHRINRNFNDPSAPYNDKIVDANTWKNNYNPDKPENYSKINLGDVNAVQLGTWLTFWVRSSYNLNIRTIDKSNVDEYLMCGNYRSFYPNYGQLADGNQKIPDSAQYNQGFTKSVSEKYYFEVPDVPYIKQEFQNRIVFSDIHINDAYKNGFRVIRTMNHKDFPMTYGSITKLIDLKNALLIIFEHGIGLVSINNQAEHSSQILSDLNIISDTYGSQWKDSIIKTPSGIYGVDTVAKKIWRVKEGQLELISDMKVQEFLNQNITVSERELTPMIGIRNVKTVYNAFKHDVMFTFYDNRYGCVETSWNLCWNEILGMFTTFYSWIPGEMVNIDNIPFSFDRTTIKAISKLGVGNHRSDFADGITLTNNVINDDGTVDDTSLIINYVDENGILQEKEVTNYGDIKGFVGFLNIDNRILPNNDYQVTYTLKRDHQGNHNIFKIGTISVDLNPTYNAIIPISYVYLDDISKLPKDSVRYLNIKATVSGNIQNTDSTIEFGYFESQVAVTTKHYLTSLTTDFWKHGQAGIIDIQGKVKPTHWYGQQHPFEFEFVVVDDPSVHKIFTNLELVSNKVKPESFHYEVIGDVYDFADDKPTMYFRQEALKALYQYNGYDIEYNPNFLEITPKQHNRSANLPKYYSRWNTVNEIYDSYKRFAAKDDFNYDHLAGAEIVYYPTRNEFRVWNHVEAIDADSKVLDKKGMMVETSVIKANCRYLEDKWLVSINPIIVTYKNEFNKNLVPSGESMFSKENIEVYKYSSWVKAHEKSRFDKLPPINIQGTKLNEESVKNNKPIEFPGIYDNEPKGEDNALYELYDLNNWNSGQWSPIDPTKNKERRETDVRGKFMKVRVRYSGNELAIIDFLNTIYQISFA